MSTRSSVIIAISIDVDIPIKVRKAMLDADRQHIDEEKGAMYWYWESVKWNNGEGEVGTIMDFLSSLEYEDYGFMELGEYNEVDERGDVMEYGLGFEIKLVLPF